MDETPIAPAVAIGAVAGAVLGGVAGSLGGHLDGNLVGADRPSAWVLTLYPGLAVYLTAFQITADKGAGLGKALLWAPVIATGQLSIALVWLAAYFVVLPAPAILAFFWFYGHPLINSWPNRVNAALLAFLVLAGWLFFLSRIRLGKLVDAFYAGGLRAIALIGSAVLACIPFLLVGVLVAYYAGYVENPSWQSGPGSGLIGGTIGAVYGASVGFFTPFTVLIVSLLDTREWFLGS